MERGQSTYRAIVVAVAVILLVSVPLMTYSAISQSGGGAASINVSSAQGLFSASSDAMAAAGTTLTAESSSLTAGNTLNAPTTDEVVDFVDLLCTEGGVHAYSYDDLSADIAVLARSYPEWVYADSIGMTADGRAIHHFVVGNPNAANKVLIHAGIHAREYCTTQLVMRQTSAFLQAAAEDDSFNNIPYRQLLVENAIHVVPSVNPDGWMISLQGLDGLQTDAMHQKVLEIASMDGTQATSEYLRAWKANANGVDLNRNFDALWNEYAGTPHPSSDRYKGEAPGSEPETRALINLTEQEGFSRTISYHTHGSVIYWYFGQEGVLYEDTLRFAEGVSAVTGYPLDANYANLDPAGYKDWALQTLGIPSLTIEVGWGGSPVPFDQYDAIYTQNQQVWEAVLALD